MQSTFWCRVTVFGAERRCYCTLDATAPVLRHPGARVSANPESRPPTENGATRWIPDSPLARGAAMTE
jgi:hypothetical protein